MNSLDDRIRRALHENDDAMLAELGEEPDIFAQVLETFRHRSRWLVLMSMVIGIAFMAFSVVSFVQLLRVDDVRSMIAWAMGVVFGVVAVMGMKVWYWMELQKNAIAREIKRLELRIVRLGASR